MSELRITQEGEALFSSNPELQSNLDEFAQVEPDVFDMQKAKSYRGDYLGWGMRGEVYAVKGYPVAEKIIRSGSSAGHTYFNTFAHLERNLQARNHWLANKPLDSSVYVPEYYAAVEHEDGRGAILLEKIGNGVNVGKLEAINNTGRKEDRIKMAQEIGGNDFGTILDLVNQAIMREHALISSIFATATFSDMGPVNMIVDWVAEGEVGRPIIGVIDV